jgi:hypothetical protein
MRTEPRTIESTTSPGAKRVWQVPRLQFRGTVGEVLRSGGGKLSLSGGDPGEMRCEKPHSASCRD